MSKKKSKKKTNLLLKIRANAKKIIIVAVSIAIISGGSFYLGMSSPRTISIPVNLMTIMGLSLDYDTAVTYGPAHTGIRVSFEVTSASHSWSLDIRDSNGNPLEVLSSSGTGTFTTTTWLYAPDGCIILIHVSSSFPASMNLDGILTITSSRFPYI
ncbi:MAG: hypothetical protein RTU09_00580 [Candidatus Thorarchaeota archaeon]